MIRGRVDPSSDASTKLSSPRRSVGSVNMDRMEDLGRQEDHRLAEVMRMGKRTNRIRGRKKPL